MCEMTCRAACAEGGACTLGFSASAGANKAMSKASVDNTAWSSAAAHFSWLQLKMRTLQGGREGKRGGTVVLIRGLMKV